MKFTDLRMYTGLPWWPLIVAPLVALLIAGGWALKQDPALHTTMTIRVATPASSAIQQAQAQSDVLGMVGSEWFAAQVAEEVSADAEGVHAALSAVRGDTAQLVDIMVTSPDQGLVDELVAVVPEQVQAELFRTSLSDDELLLELAEADHAQAMAALEEQRESLAVVSIDRAIQIQSAKVSALRAALHEDPDNDVLEDSLREAEQVQQDLVQAEPTFQKVADEVQMTQRVLHEQRRALDVTQARQAAASEAVRSGEVLQQARLLTVSRAALGAAVVAAGAAAIVYAVAFLIRRRPGDPLHDPQRATPEGGRDGRAGGVK